MLGAAGALGRQSALGWRSARASARASGPRSRWRWRWQSGPRSASRSAQGIGTAVHGGLGAGLALGAGLDRRRANQDDQRAAGQVLQLERPAARLDPPDALEGRQERCSWVMIGSSQAIWVVANGQIATTLPFVV